jgi:hypothetical protein
MYVHDVCGGGLAFASSKVNRFGGELNDFFGVNFRYVQGNSGVSHIDSSVMIASPYVFVDNLTYGYQESAFANLGDYILKVVDISSEFRFMPLNCQVLNNRGKPFVIANSNTPKFLEELSNCGIDYETVNANMSPIRKKASIKCLSNEVSDHDTLLRALSKSFYRH